MPSSMSAWPTRGGPTRPRSRRRSDLGETRYRGTRVSRESPTPGSTASACQDPACLSRASSLRDPDGRDVTATGIFPAWGSTVGTLSSATCGLNRCQPSPGRRSSTERGEETGLATEGVRGVREVTPAAFPGRRELEPAGLWTREDHRRLDRCDPLFAPPLAISARESIVVARGRQTVEAAARLDVGRRDLSCSGDLRQPVDAVRLRHRFVSEANSNGDVQERVEREFQCPGCEPR